MVRILTAYVQIVCIILATAVGGTCRADISSPSDGFSAGGSEFYVGRESGRPLMTVSIISGVTRPGVYHIPIQSTLPQLIAFAGGTIRDAEVSDIHIRRTGAQGPAVLKYDLNVQFKELDALPILQDKDFVQIPQNASWDNSLRWLTLIAGLAHIALSVALVNQISHHP